MNNVAKTIRFSVEAEGQLQTAISAELTLVWAGVQWECYDSGWTGYGPSQTAAILNWLAHRLGIE